MTLKHSVEATCADYRRAKRFSKCFKQLKQRLRYVRHFFTLPVTKIYIKFNSHSLFSELHQCLQLFEFGPVTEAGKATTPLRNCFWEKFHVIVPLQS